MICYLVHNSHYSDLFKAEIETINPNFKQTRLSLCFVYDEPKAQAVSHYSYIVF